MCCSFLTRSYDFTSALSRLILSYYSQHAQFSAVNKQNKLILDSLPDLNMDERTVYITFGILNRLASDNKFFQIDSYVEQLIQLSIDKIAQKEYKNMYFQLLANALRNNGTEVEQLIKSSIDYKQFCRQLLNLIKERNLNPNVILNSLTILVKLCFDQLFGTMNQTTIGQFNNIMHHQMLNAENKTKIYESLDLAMRVLCRNTEDIANLKKQYDINERTTIRFNALNFIYELVKYSPVKYLLERYDRKRNL